MMDLVTEREKEIARAACEAVGISQDHAYFFGRFEVRAILRGEHGQPRRWGYGQEKWGLFLAAVLAASESSSCSTLRTGGQR